VRKLQTGISWVDWCATFCANLGCLRYIGKRVNLAAYTEFFVFIEITEQHFVYDSLHCCKL
jgi:hypothetical protein